MLGVLDSGEGGENAVAELTRLLPTLDIMLLKDRKNAPYGTKEENELIRITREGVGRLLSYGCRRVLIACCTASTVHKRLPTRQRELSVPIILPTARRARELSRTGKIALIATDATVRSHAFTEVLGDALISELGASRLVYEIERGACDGNISPELRRYLYALLRRAAHPEVDTLILGCTHFARIEGEILKIYREITGRKITAVDSAREGARALASECTAPERGCGRLTRIE